MTKTLNLHKFTFESNTYSSESIEDTLDISTTAPAQDYHLSDEVIECDINKDEAIKLILFLKDHFSIR
jgi:hypothetical protein